jgi:hypothetical protein
MLIAFEHAWAFIALGAFGLVAVAVLYRYRRRLELARERLAAGARRPAPARVVDLRALDEVGDEVSRTVFVGGFVGERVGRLPEV